MRKLLFALFVLLLPLRSEAQTTMVCWDPLKPAVSPAVPTQSFRVYRNGMLLFSVPYNETCEPIPPPLIGDVIEVSAVGTDPNTGALLESARVSPGGQVPPPPPPPVPSACAKGQFKASYFSNVDFSGTPIVVQCEQSINYDWGLNPPLAGMPSDYFSVRWEGQFDIAAGETTFTYTTDDGMRAYLNGTQIFNSWQDQSPTTYNVKKSLTSATYTYVVEYYEGGGGATAKASMTTVATPPPPPPPTDPCATTPLRFSVSRWPAATTGSRSFNYSSDRPVQVSLDLRTTPWKAVATDNRGCIVMVTR